MRTDSWLDLRKSTYRWEDFCNWLDAGFLGPIPPDDPLTQAWLRLPVNRVRRLAQGAHLWVETVLAERQQRGLSWQEASDGPRLAGQLAVGLVREEEVWLHRGWLGQALEEEMRGVIRLLEAPDRMFPVGVRGRRVGQPWEQRCWGLAIGLMRVGQWVGALGQMCGGPQAVEEMRAAAARVRQQVTRAAPAA
jgi:hypothetical protein